MPIFNIGVMGSTPFSLEVITNNTKTLIYYMIVTKPVIQFLHIQFFQNKNLIVSLTHIFGINFCLATEICIKFGFTKSSLVGDVPLDLLRDLRKFIITTYSIQSSLQNKISLNISDLTLNRSYRGLRHKLQLPVRGQRTRTNHKTQKNVR